MKKIFLLLIASVIFIGCDKDDNEEQNEEISTDINGVVISGVRWATRNVNTPGNFAANPEDAGMLFQWDRNVGWSNTDPLTSSNGDIWDNSFSVEKEWARWSNPCPQGWRVPTQTELQSLVDAGSRWVTHNGINGRFFGVAPNRIFLPVTKARGIDGDKYVVELSDKIGSYWSSTRHDNATAYLLIFNNIERSKVPLHTMAALSIRCVADE